MALQHVYTNLTTLINEARDLKTFISLATFKPSKIIAFNMVQTTSTDSAKKKRSIVKRKLARTSSKDLVDMVPYKFYYTLIDDSGKRSRMQILDWEIYQLCRKLMRKYDKKKAVLYSHLNQKYFQEFIQTRDLYLFLGTNKYWHIRRSNNPFMIIGIFYPPK